jgi:hypothetical protein
MAIRQKLHLSPCPDFRDQLCRLLPRSCSLPQMAGGSASALSLSRPAQASLTLRPTGSLSRPQATFVTRLQPFRLPSRAARQLPDQSTTLRVESSSTGDSRLRGALPRGDIGSAAKEALFNYLVGEREQAGRNFDAEFAVARLMTSSNLVHPPQ